MKYSPFKTAPAESPLGPTTISYDEIETLIPRPIAFSPVHVKLTGSVTAGLMLGQIRFWDSVARKKGRNDGRFYHSEKEWTAEIGLSRREQEGARRCLKTLGLIDESYERLRHQLWYRFNREVFCRLLSELLNEGTVENRHWGTPERDVGEGAKGPLTNDQKRRSSIHRLPSEITPRNTHRSQSFSPSKVSVKQKAMWLEDL